MQVIVGPVMHGWSHTPVGAPNGRLAKAQKEARHNVSKHLPILHTCKGYQGWRGIWRLWLRQVVTACAGDPLVKNVVWFPPLCAHAGVKPGVALAVQFASFKLKPTF